jgi:type I site-specific restriction endonuclease
VDRKSLGVLEAKKKCTLPRIVAEQSGQYAESLSDFLAATNPGPLPFLYESTDVEIFFGTNETPNRVRGRFSIFHHPETLAEWLAQSSLSKGQLHSGGQFAP